jgi:hypothetical protein
MAGPVTPEPPDEGSSGGGGGGETLAVSSIGFHITTPNYPSQPSQDFYIYFTIRYSYNLEINPKNGARRWTMEVWAGPNAYHPAQYQTLLDIISLNTIDDYVIWYMAEDGESYLVKIKDTVKVTGNMQGLPVVALSFEEPGFSDSSSDEEIIMTMTLVNDETSNTVGVFQFDLSNYSMSADTIGEMQRMVNGGFIRPSGGLIYPVHTFTIPEWGTRALTVGTLYSFQRSYKSASGTTVTITGSGRLVEYPTMAGDTITFSLHGETPITGLAV